MLGFLKFFFRNSWTGMYP